MKQLNLHTSHISTTTTTSVLGLIVLIMEWPLVMPDYFNAPSSFMPKVAFYIPVAILSMLEAQAINGGVYLSIGILAYMMAVRADFMKQSLASARRMP